MRYFPAILATALAISLTGCVLRGQPKVVANAAPPPPKAEVTPAPPPAPPQKLSIPQTNVELPAPQPLSDEALASTVPSGDPAPPAPTPQRSPKRTPSQSAAQQQPKPEPAPPPAPAPAQPLPAAETPRPAVQEIVSDEEKKKLLGEAQMRRKEIRQRLDQVANRRLNATERGLVNQIEAFEKLSDEAEKGGDARQAFELAERGLLLAKELTGGR